MGGRVRQQRVALRGRIWQLRRRTGKRTPSRCSKLMVLRPEDAEVTSGSCVCVRVAMFSAVLQSEWYVAKSPGQLQNRYLSVFLFRPLVCSGLSSDSALGTTAVGVECEIPDKRLLSALRQGEVHPLCLGLVEALSSRPRRTFLY